MALYKTILKQYYTKTEIGYLGYKAHLLYLKVT